MHLPGPCSRFSGVSTARVMDVQEEMTSQEFHQVWGCWCNPASWWLLPAAVLPRQGIAPPLQDVCMVSQLLAAQAGKQVFSQGLWSGRGAAFLQRYLKETSDELSSAGHEGHIAPRFKKDPWDSKWLETVKGTNMQSVKYLFEWYYSCSIQNSIFYLAKSPRDTEAAPAVAWSPSSLAALYLFVFFPLVSLSQFA